MIINEGFAYNNIHAKRLHELFHINSAKIIAKQSKEQTEIYLQTLPAGTIQYDGAGRVMLPLSNGTIIDITA